MSDVPLLKKGFLAKEYGRDIYDKCILNSDVVGAIKKVFSKLKKVFSVCYWCKSNKGFHGFEGDSYLICDNCNKKVSRKKLWENTLTIIFKEEFGEFDE